MSKATLYIFVLVAIVINIGFAAYIPRMKNKQLKLQVIGANIFTFICLAILVYWIAR